MSLQRNRFAAWAFGVAARLSGALAGLPNRLVPPPFRLLQIGSLYWQSRALYVAARLDLAGILADRCLTPAELAAEAGADADAVHRLLRLLAAMGVFAQAAGGRYRNNRLSDALRPDRANNVRAMVLMHNAPDMSRPWFEQLEQGVRTGQVPFELAHGRDFYGYMDDHPEFDALFAEAMDRVEALVGDSFATSFDWSRFRRIIDVGGSVGAKSMAILRRHPQLEAMVVDRAQTIAGAPEYWRARGGECLARMRFMAGDVLASVPAAQDAGDVYLLSAVLHGFDDDTCVRALATVAAAAAPAGATIVLLEMVLAESGADIAAAAMDMQMFMATRGRERTAAEWSRLFARSGLRLDETVHLPSFAKMMVLRP